jgi:hypothetical protein
MELYKDDAEPDPANRQKTRPNELDHMAGFPPLAAAKARGGPPDGGPLRLLYSAGDKPHITGRVHGLPKTRKLEIVTEDAAAETHGELSGCAGLGHGRLRNHTDNMYEA